MFLSGVLRLDVWSYVLWCAWCERSFYWGVFDKYESALMCKGGVCDCVWKTCGARGDFLYRLCLIFFSWSQLSSMGLCGGIECAMLEYLMA